MQTGRACSGRQAGHADRNSTRTAFGVSLKGFSSCLATCTTHGWAMSSVWPGNAILFSQCVASTVRFCSASAWSELPVQVECVGRACRLDTVIRQGHDKGARHPCSTPPAINIPTRPVLDPFSTRSRPVLEHQQKHRN